MKTIASLFVFAILSVTVPAQNWEKYLPQEKLENGTITLTDYQEAFRKYYEPYNIDKNGYYMNNGKKERIGGWKQFKRWEWFMEGEVDPGTKQFPKTDARTEWENYLKRYPNASRSAYGGLDWPWAIYYPRRLPGTWQAQLYCVPSNLFQYLLGGCTYRWPVENNRPRYELDLSFG